MLSDDNDVAPEFLDMAALKYSMYCKDAMSGACGKTVLDDLLPPCRSIPSVSW